MEILIDDPLLIERWKEFAEGNPHSSPFQTPQFLELCNSVPGFRAKAIAVGNGCNLHALAVAVIQKETGIRGYFSRRAVIYGGPLIDPAHPEALGNLLSEISVALHREVIYVESRNYSDYKDFEEIFRSNGWRFIPYLNLTIDLRDKSLEDIYKDMHYNRRRQIRSSLETGASYRECESESELTAIYDILVDLYSDRVKVPLPDFLFFKALWQRAPGKVFVVLHEEKVIGGSFCVIQPGRNIYTMYYCGLRNYNRKIYPTHLAVLATLEYGLGTGLKMLDFMGGGIKNREYGVRKYKQEFGGIINEYGRNIKIFNRFLYNLGRAAIWLGRFSIKNSG